MIWAILAIIWVAVDLLLVILYKGTGFKVSVTLSPLGTWNLLDWQWQLVANQRDDSGDFRLYPNKLRDEGFAVSPLCFRLVANRVVIIEQGHGPVVVNETEREKMREKRRRVVE